MSKASFRYQDISDLFDLEMFLKQKHSSERQFYRSFSDTQTFTSFIEQRSFAHAESTTLAFFDECTDKVKDTLLLIHHPLINTSPSYSTSWFYPVGEAGGKLPPKLPSFPPNFPASPQTSQLSPKPSTFPPNVACCEPYIALNCISGDLKFKIFWEEPSH